MDGKSLSATDNGNANPFFAKQPISRPLISEKAPLKGIEGEINIICFFQNQAVGAKWIYPQNPGIAKSNRDCIVRCRHEQSIDVYKRQTLYKSDSGPLGIRCSILYVFYHMFSLFQTLQSTNHLYRHEL